MISRRDLKASRDVETARPTPSGAGVDAPHAGMQCSHLLRELRIRTGDLEARRHCRHRQRCHRGVLAPHAASHCVSWAALDAYTIRPSPTHACAAAHIGQCSPEVYTVERARSAGERFTEAQRASANSGCRVRSPPATRLRSSHRTMPLSSTNTDPNGSSPASSASRARSTQRRSRSRSSAVSGGSPALVAASVRVPITPE